jgi:protease II
VAAPDGRRRRPVRLAARSRRPDTIAYLEAENAHADAWFAERADLVEAIFGEIKSRVQETDLSAPVSHHGAGGT